MTVAAMFTPTDFHNTPEVTSLAPQASALPAVSIWWSRPVLRHADRRAARWCG
jgi:hypothetical protein